MEYCTVIIKEAKCPVCGNYQQVDSNGKFCWHERYIHGYGMKLCSGSETKAPSHLRIVPQVRVRR